MNILLLTSVLVILLYIMKDIFKINSHWMNNILILTAVIYISFFQSVYILILIIVLYHIYRGLKNIITDYIHDSKIRSILDSTVILLCLITLFNYSNVVYN